MQYNTIQCSIVQYDMLYICTKVKNLKNKM